jgi:hypothetical protein
VLYIEGPFFEKEGGDAYEHDGARKQERSIRERKKNNQRR